MHTCRFRISPVQPNHVAISPSHQLKAKKEMDHWIALLARTAFSRHPEEAFSTQATYTRSIELVTA
jgi:hypothetical protein